MSVAQALSTGDKAPLFKAPVLSAASKSSPLFDSASLHGQVVYVDFWASWCGPCRVSLPALENIYSEFSDQGFTVAAVNVDRDKKNALSFLEERPVSYTVLYDAQGNLPEAFGVKGMPTAFLLDRQGNIRHIHEGFRPGEEVKLREMIRELIEEHGQ